MAIQSDKNSLGYYIRHHASNSHNTNPPPGLHFRPSTLPIKRHTRPGTRIHPQLTTPAQISPKTPPPLHQKPPLSTHKKTNKNSQNVRSGITPHGIEIHLRLRQLAPAQLRVHDLLAVPHGRGDEGAQRSDDAGAPVAEHVVGGPGRAVRFAVAGVVGGEGWVVGGEVGDLGFLGGGG